MNLNGFWTYRLYMILSYLHISSHKPISPPGTRHFGTVGAPPRSCRLTATASRSRSCPLAVLTTVGSTTGDATSRLPGLTRGFMSTPRWGGGRGGRGMCVLYVLLSCCHGVYYITLLPHSSLSPVTPLCKDPRHPVHSIRSEGVHPPPSQCGGVVR